MGCPISCKSCKRKIRVNEKSTGHKAIPVKIINEVKKSICKIIIKKEKDIFGTGFFMKIKSLKFLFTNYHVINQEYINDNIELEIWNKEKMNLNLNQRYIKYFKDQKDVTIIEIKEKDEIYKDIKFLDYDSNYKEKGYNCYENADLFTLEHPLGNDVSSASGTILKIEEDYEFTHNISTEGGSSGCPIILLNNTINLILVVGIHKSAEKDKEENYGTFIGGIIDEIKNDSFFVPNLIKNKELKTEEEQKEKEQKEKENEEEQKEEEMTKKNLMKKDNFIIAQINIKKKEVNKYIRIISSYEEYMEYKGYKDKDLKEGLKNEKEIEQCEIIINNKKNKFTYFFAFKNEGIYKIKYTFKNLLTKINHLFFDCSSLISIDLSNFNSQNVTNMELMFCGCSSLKEIKLSNFKAQKVIDMEKMFYECSSLKRIDLSNFYAPNATNMSYMLYGCSSLKKINLSNFKSQKVIDMSYMFNKCSSLISLDLSNFYASNVTNMFSECSSLKSIDLSSFNTQNVTDMSYMFSKCSSLENIDLSSFNTQNVTNMNFMFSECSSLENIDLSSFNTQKVTNMYKMFYLCSSLKAVNLHNFIFTKVKWDNYSSDNYSFFCLVNVLNYVEKI